MTRPLHNVYALALSAHRVVGINVECFLLAAFACAYSVGEAEARFMTCLLDACPPSQGWGGHQIRAQLVLDADSLREFPFTADLLVTGSPFATDGGDGQEEGDAEGAGLIM